MIWGAISFKGKSKLIITRGNMKSSKYQEILKEAERSIKVLHPKKFIFQQDGATCYTSVASINWLKSVRWTVSSWPSNSPGLNPIENLWKLMKEKVEKTRPTNLKDLEEIINRIWEEFSLTIIKSLVSNMNRRIQKCIELKGEHIE
jgi:hypothetical protein